MMVEQTVTASMSRLIKPSVNVSVCCTMIPASSHLTPDEFQYTIINKLLLGTQIERAKIHDPPNDLHIILKKNLEN